MAATETPRGATKLGRDQNTRGNEGKRGGRKMTRGATDAERQNGVMKEAAEKGRLLWWG